MLNDCQPSVGPVRGGEVGRNPTSQSPVSNRADSFPRQVLFSSASVHWATPKALYEQLDKEFHFDFDPCPLGEMESDGSAPLFTSWVGKRVFCNPPYNKGIVRFLERALEAEVAVFLLPARTDQKWFHNICLPGAKEIRFMKGRLRFGDATSPAPFPSMVVVFRKVPQLGEVP